MYLSRYRKFVDTMAPTLGVVYRSLRDVAVSRRVARTSYGFTIAGAPFMAEDYEAAEVKSFLELIDSHDVVIDVGANVGFYSCLAAMRGKHVIAVEPSSRNLEFLYKNLSDNGLLAVEVLPVGLGKQHGLRRIYGFGGIASFVPGWGQAKRNRFCTVPMTTLDNIAAARFREKKILIKVDVEGFELEVLAGALETLRLDPKPTWLLEIMLRNDLIPGGLNNRFAETFQLFWDHGYKCQRLDSDRTYVQPSDVGRWTRNGAVDFGPEDFLFVENHYSSAKSDDRI